MRKKWVIFIVIVLFVFNYLEQEVRAEAIYRNSTENNKARIISVIFDDSTSMIQDDIGNHEYTTRWVDADYAVKAMASMMDARDTLRLYFMGEYAETGEKKNLKISTENKNTAISEVEKYMDELKYVNETDSSAMDAAKNDFTSKELSEKECWIVILTDGRFTKPKQLDEEKLKEKLVELTQVDSGNLYVAYVPIGDGAIQLSDDIMHHIIVPEEKNNVTEQVTEIINRIYGRVRMDNEVSREYLSVENNQIIIRTDVPLEKVVVFLQHQGNEELYLEYQKRKENSDSGGSVAILDTEAGICTPAYLGQTTFNSFSGKKTKPNSSKDIEKVKYHELQGTILTWTGNPDSGSSDFTDQEFVIPVKQGLELQIEVYYQPAVSVGFEYIQNGISVEHLEDCDFKGVCMEQEEFCLQEGQLDVKLKMVDLCGIELEQQLSPFLYPDKFKVILRSEDGMSDVEMVRGYETYQYGGSVNEEKYVMEILTPWNEMVTQKLDVQEKHKPLEIVPLNIQLVVDDATGNHSQIKMILNEDQEILSIENRRRVTITCGEDEYFEYEPLDFADNGIYSVLVSLKDKSQHQLPETVTFHINATRSYDRGSDVTGEAKVEMQITSGMHTMEIKCAEVEQIDAASCFWHSQELPLEYYCDNEKLTEQQRENLTVELIVEGTELKGLVEIGKNKNLILKRSLKWFNIPEQDFFVELHPGYVKYNRSIEDMTYTVTLPVHAMPLWKKIIIITVMVFVLGWIMVCIGKRFLPIHIRKEDFILVGKGAPYPCSLYRKGNLYLPWQTTAWVVLEKGNVEGGITPMPAIRLKIRNNREGEGYVLCNYKDFMDKERFRIGNLPITEQNSIFSNGRQFSLRNGYGEFVNLCISKHQ